METGDALLARRAAVAGGETAAAQFRGGFAVESKAHKNDLVTAADRAAQERVVQTIREESDAPVVAEEGDLATTIPTSGPVWIVDPIDGTANFARGVRLWTTSVAAVVDGRPVAAANAFPAMGDVYVADGDGVRIDDTSVSVSDRTDPETFAVGALGFGPPGQREAYAALSRKVIERFGDMRRFGSMQATLSFVASGGLDAAVAPKRPNPWDSVAGAFMIERAGGTVTDLAGDEWQPDSDHLVASNGRAHDAVLDVARAVTD